MTESDFLRAVLADRADDTPRIVYADWLDEHGQPERSEFIRVQCEIAGFQRSVGAEHLPHAHENTLRRRERELTGHWDGVHFIPGLIEWNDVYRREFGFLPPDDWRWEFRRGFITIIALPAVAWLGGACGRCNECVGGASGKCVHPTPVYADALLACTPLEEVYLTTWPTGIPLGHPAVRALLADRWPSLRFSLPGQIRVPRFTPPPPPHTPSPAPPPPPA